MIVITQNFRDSQSLLFALEGRWILAGGETTGKPVIIAFAPWQGRGTVARSITISSIAFTSRAPAGARRIGLLDPVVSPPANFRCASGAKLKRFG